MSDMGDEYIDPALEELLYQIMATGGYQPFGANMNVPYAQDYMGGNTDPTRQWKSQDTILKSQGSLMGFNPIQEFAGPEPELWIPGTEQLANEVLGDEDGEKLLAALESGAGVLALQKQIADATYDPENEDPSEERPLSPQQAAVYRDWLERYSKAQAEDYIKLGQPGTVTDPMELDPMGDVATAPEFTEDEFIQKLVTGGAFGSGYQQAPSVSRPDGSVTSMTGDEERQGRVRRAVEKVLSPFGGGTRKVMGPPSPGSPRQPSDRKIGPLERARDQGNRQLEQKYRQDYRKSGASQGGSRPSMAKERAFRAIVAYRMAHGMSPT
jgi:hypothetical protein